MIFHVLLQKFIEKFDIFSQDRLLVGIADLTGTLLGNIRSIFKQVDQTRVVSVTSLLESSFI